MLVRLNSQYLALQIVALRITPSARRRKTADSYEEAQKAQELFEKMIGAFSWLHFG
jgi:hypothetical protein